MACDQGSAVPRKKPGPSLSWATWAGIGAPLLASSRAASAPRPCLAQGASFPLLSTLSAAEPGGNVPPKVGLCSGGTAREEKDPRLHFALSDSSELSGKLENPVQGPGTSLGTTVIHAYVICAGTHMQAYTQAHIGAWTEAHTHRITCVQPSQTHIDTYRHT